MKKVVILVIVIMSTLFGCTYQDTGSNQSPMQSQSNLKKGQLDFPIAPDPVAYFNQYQRIYESDKYLFFAGTDIMKFSMINKVTSQIFEIDKRTKGFYYSGDYIIYLSESGYKVITLDKDQNCYLESLSLDSKIFSSPVIIGQNIYWCMKQQDKYKFISTDLHGNNKKEITNIESISFDNFKVYKNRLIVYKDKFSIVKYDTQTNKIKNIFDHENYSVGFSAQGIAAGRDEYINFELENSKTILIDIFSEKRIEVDCDMEMIKKESADILNRSLTLLYWDDEILKFSISPYSDQPNASPEDIYEYDIKKGIQKFCQKSAIPYYKTCDAYEWLGDQDSYRYIIGDYFNQNSKIIKTNDLDVTQGIILWEIKS